MNREGRNVDHTHFQSSVNALANRKLEKWSLVIAPSMRSMCVCQCVKRIAMFEIHAQIVGMWWKSSWPEECKYVNGPF